MKNYQKFILALVFVGTLLSSFHYHADGHSSSECQVCVLQHSIGSADIPERLCLQCLSIGYETPVGAEGISHTARIYHDSLSRAPPLFS